MGELCQEFLNKTISDLQVFQKETTEKDSLEFEFLQKYFRWLHTVKGTSNTFNLSNLAHLAHEIESLVQAILTRIINQPKEIRELISESFGHLLSVAADYQLNLKVKFPSEFSEKLNSIIPKKDKNLLNDFLATKIPQSVLNKLAEQEKNKLNIEIQNDKNFYSLETFFDILTFDADFKEFKEVLAKNGEIIAVLPVAKPSENIGFKIYFVSKLAKYEISEIIHPHNSKIEFEINFALEKYADNLDGVTQCLVNIGERTATLLDKKIAFERYYDDVQVDSAILILLKGIGSQLLYNSIDHAIESSAERIAVGKPLIGLIKITVKNEKGFLLFQIEDDGQGINPQQVTDIAKARNLISADRNLTQKEALEMIFSQGFSSKENISELSGRGVGLNAVKELVEDSGGIIKFETTLGKGTIFSVYLSQN